MTTILFFTRLGLYLLLISTPLYVSPAVVVAYDSYGWFVWFFLAPIEMGLAYFLRPPRFSWKVSWLWAFGSALAGGLLFSGFDREAMLLVCLVALYAYGATRLIFRSALGPGIAALEVFLFAFIYFRLLSFTRSAPDIAKQFPLLAKSLLILLILSFLIHGLVIYLAAFPDRSFARRRRDIGVFAAIAVPLLIIFVFISPLDFVEHQVALNQFQEEPPPSPEELEQGEGASPSIGEPDSSRNGLPLGDRKEKYPSELQGGASRNDEETGEQGGGQEKDQGKDQERPPRGGAGQPGERDSREGRGEGRSSRGGAADNSQRLEGIPADQWRNYMDSGEGEGKQHAVMVIASLVNPVYAAEAYLGQFSVEQGFTATPTETEPLNGVSGLHLIETWRDRLTSLDDLRNNVPLFFLSTIERRVVPYRPFQIQPTVQNRVYHPFDLSYHAQSRISISRPKDWKLVRDLNQVEQERMKPYLELSISPGEREPFLNYLSRLRSQYSRENARAADRAEDEVADRAENGAEKGILRASSSERYFDRIDLILKGFRQHRYEVGFEENRALGHLRQFLTVTKSGDCTEFAHSAALLGRLSGLPSRVVVGYLASEDLQTAAHRGGLYHLRKAIKPLQEYPLDQLYLVTSAHRHAWVQYWLPGYGWIDFEATSYAIPPKPEMNPNNMDVIIPMIEEEARIAPRPFLFPWRLALELMAATALAILATLYLYRFGRQIFLRLIAGGHNSRALHAFQLLTLAPLASDGYPLKLRHQTMLEYTESNPNLKPLREVAELFTLLQFKERYQPGEREKIWQKLRTLRQKALSHLRRKGPLRFLRRLLSLRSLYY